MHAGFYDRLEIWMVEMNVLSRGQGFVLWMTMIGRCRHVGRPVLGLSLGVPNEGIRTTIHHPLMLGSNGSEGCLYSKQETARRNVERLR